MYHCNLRIKIDKKDWDLVVSLFSYVTKTKNKKPPLIKEDFYFLYHTCPQVLDNLTNWKIPINQKAQNPARWQDRLKVIHGNSRKNIPQHSQRHKTYQGSQNTTYHLKSPLVKALNSHKMEENPKKAQTIISHTVNGKIGNTCIIDTVKWEDVLIFKESYTSIFGWIGIRYPKIDSLS